MARTTISIPDDLKRRMEAVADQNVNWSAVAAKAFESKLAEFITKNGAKDMQEVIDRLRADKAECMDIHQKMGMEDGREWAMKQASYANLKAVVDYYDRLRVNNAWGGVVEEEPSVEHNDWTLAMKVYGAIVPCAAEDEDYLREESATFWQRTIGDSAPLNGRVAGFVLGAAEVWGQVRDHL